MEGAAGAQSDDTPSAMDDRMEPIGSMSSLP